MVTLKVMMISSGRWEKCELGTRLLCESLSSLLSGRGRDKREGKGKENVRGEIELSIFSAHSGFDYFWFI